jgi:hypothetical protein
MEPVGELALLVVIVIAATAIFLLRQATIENRRVLVAAREARPEAPIVRLRSPAFVATVSGRRYHLGCVVGEQDVRYAVWTTRSHRVVELFEASEAGWCDAWRLYAQIEYDDSPAWLDHRGAPRSRKEWGGHPAQRLSVATSAGHVASGMGTDTSRARGASPERDPS